MKKRITIVDIYSYGIRVSYMPVIVLTGVVCGVCECVSSTILLTKTLFKNVDEESEDQGSE